MDGTNYRYAQPNIAIPGAEVPFLPSQSQSQSTTNDVKKLCGTCWGCEGTCDERLEIWRNTVGFIGCVGFVLGVCGVPMKLGFCGDGLIRAGTIVSERVAPPLCTALIPYRCLFGCPEPGTPGNYGGA